MIEGCKHGPAFMIPQPCAKCERARQESAEQLQGLASQIGELQRKADAIERGTETPATAPARALLYEADLFVEHVDGNKGAVKLVGLLGSALRIALAVPVVVEPPDHRCGEHTPCNSPRRCIREVGHEGEHIDMERRYWTTPSASDAPAPKDPQ